MKTIKIITIFFVLIFLSSHSFASETYFIDMRKLMNQSKAGKEAQEQLKKKLVSEDKKLKKEGEELKKKEVDLISKKKTMSEEEYKKNINSLREKNVAYQKKRASASSDFAKRRNKGRNELLKAINPILKKYMDENNIKLIVDKKYVVMGTTSIDLTDKILVILDKELKSLNLN